jgi:hypothetical protein
MFSVSRQLIAVLAALLSIASIARAEEASARLIELDAYWAEVSRTVKQGDFEGYSATALDEAVFVTGNKKAAYPLAKALARWKQEFDDTRAGIRSSSVEFRFSQRLGDATTAHETGIFLYTFQQGSSDLKKEYVHFEALLIKKAGHWKLVMEYQKSLASAAEWSALRP